LGWLNLYFAAQGLQYGERFSDLSSWLAALQINNEPDAHVCGAGELVLPEALRASGMANGETELAWSHNVLSRTGISRGFGPLSREKLPIGNMEPNGPIFRQIIPVQ
jgi:hypothetical protein